MNAAALGLVLAAALLHASWNFLTKRSVDKLAFIWCFALVTVVCYAPVLYWYWPQPILLPARGWILVALTGMVHAIYYRLLAGAYERGGLSLVYPLARGSAPLLVPLPAVLFLGERLSLLGLAGICLVVGGIFVLHLPAFSLARRQRWGVSGGATLWALGAGCSIACYSLVDKLGVQLIPPPLYIYLMMLATWLMLTPVVLGRQRQSLLREWRLNWGKVIAVGLLDPFTYVLVLFALRLSSVSYVAAVREVSIVFSSIYGVLLLGERDGVAKVSGAVLIAAGVVAVGLG